MPLLFALRTPNASARRLSVATARACSLGASTTGNRRPRQSPNEAERSAFPWQMTRFAYPARSTQPDWTMSIETGGWRTSPTARSSSQVGDTTVLTTVATSKPREGIDFFPLTVDVEERMYAAGKIPGSFFRREGRPGEQAILTCRLTDRPLRPSFPEGFRNEVQVIATILGADLENPHDIASINGASAALMVSGIPFNGPIGAVRMAHHDGEWIAHPTYQEGDESTFELVVAGRRTDAGEIADHDGRGRRHRGDAGSSTSRARRRSPRRSSPRASRRRSSGSARRSTSSSSCVAAVVRGARPDRDDRRTSAASTTSRRRVRRRRGEADAERRAEAMAIADKTERNDRLDETRGALLVDARRHARRAGHVRRSRGRGQAGVPLAAEAGRARRASSNEGVRIDGRGTTDIRPLSAEVGIINTAHGSGLFQRGETQVLSVAHARHAPHGADVDTIGIDDRKRYMHHYNFPPFSTGETGRVGSPKRREIGHGALAERALVPVRARRKEEWPYTLRVVSDVLSSNGSTSMASVCGSTLSLMDAGVPIKAPVAGIAMGLVYADGKYTTLTDILGAEDAFGDMDFKVAGTRDFVTALQLDTKIDGLPADVLAQALAPGEGRPAQDPRRDARRDRRAPRRRAADRAEDHQLRDPDRQDRRGHRARRARSSTRSTQETGADIVGRATTASSARSRIGSKDGATVEEAAPPHRADPRPADRRARRRVHRQGREHHQVRCVREHPPGP